MDRLRLLSSGAVAIMFGTTLVGLLALWVLGEDGIAFILGDDYRPSWFLMMTISVAYLVRTLVGPAAMALNMCGVEGRVTSGYGLGLAVGLATIYVTEPMLGPASGELGLILSELVRGAWWWYSRVSKLGLDVSILSAPVVVKYLRAG